MSTVIDVLFVITPSMTSIDETIARITLEQQHIVASVIPVTVIFGDVPDEPVLRFL